VSDLGVDAPRKLLLPLAIRVGIELVFLKDGIVEVQHGQGCLRGGFIEAY